MQKEIKQNFKKRNIGSVDYIMLLATIYFLFIVIISLWDYISNKMSRDELIVMIILIFGLPIYWLEYKDNWKKEN